MSATSATQFESSIELDNALSALLPNILCPACSSEKASLLIANHALECSNCKTTFPVYSSGIPWLFEDPTFSLLEWKARLNGFLHVNALEQQRLKNSLKDKRLSKIAHKRISKILQAKKEQEEQVLEVIAPLNLQNKDFNPHADPTSVLQSKVPKVQGLLSYYDNIFRDWSWNNGENEQLLEAIDSILIQSTELGRVLTIGAGAGRLSYDIHRKYQPDLSVLLDINPLLLLAGSRIIQGDIIHLFEFPIAPLNKDSFAVLQECKTPQATNENIVFMFADGMNPPFQAQSFDTVLTPWLIDIVPQNLRNFVPRINQILKKGGQWLNCGTLAFFHRDPSWCYSEEEVTELLEKNGFKVITSNRVEIKYLNSPVSANGRTEKVFNFCAKKVRDAVVPSKYEYLPKWILNTTKAIPVDDEFTIQSSRYLLQAQVIGAIDGNRSIEQIGALVAQQYGLQLNEATHAVRRIMVDLHERNSD